MTKYKFRFDIVDTRSIEIEAKDREEAEDMLNDLYNDDVDKLTKDSDAVELSMTNVLLLDFNKRAKLTK